MDNNISFSNGLAEIVYNNFELGNFNNDDLNYIFSCESKQGEINEREIIYSLWKYDNNDVKEYNNIIKNDYWNNKYHDKYNEKIFKKRKEIIACECGSRLQRGNLWNHKKLSKTHRKNMIKINISKYKLDR